MGCGRGLDVQEARGRRAGPGKGRLVEYRCARRHLRRRFLALASQRQNVISEPKIALLLRNTWPVHAER